LQVSNWECFTLPTAYCLDTPNAVLLATDVAARGLDIKNIENVIHYQIPRTVEDYVHRSGRTARASRLGMSVVLLDPKDVARYRKICKNLKRGKIWRCFTTTFLI
jgi:ATP-dependent RNA helicase DDX24/MAK5